MGWSLELKILNRVSIIELISVVLLLCCVVIKSSLLFCYVIILRLQKIVLATNTPL